MRFTFSFRALAALVLLGALAIPSSSHALLGLPNLTQILSLPGSGSSSGGSGSPSGSGGGLPLLPGLTLPSILPSGSSSGTLDLGTLLDNVKVQADLKLPLTLTPDGPASTTLLAIPSILSSNGQQGDILEVNVVDIDRGERDSLFHAFDGIRDWTGYDTLDLWVRPDRTVATGTVRLALYAAPDPDSGYVRLFDLPALGANEWTNVRFDLQPGDDPDLLVGAYGLDIALDTDLGLKLRPLVLGPGDLHHFRLEKVGRKARVIAEDIAGNVLDHGDHEYDGRQLLTFSRNAVTVDASDTAKARVALDFDRGISELVDVDALALGDSVTGDLAVTDGKISSDLGDFSYNLLSFGGGGEDPGTETLPADSVIAAAPDPALVGSPVLVTVTAMAEGGIPRVEGGDTVRVSVRGAAQLTPSVTDNDDGTYEATFTPSAEGTYLISATINGDPVGEDMDGTSDGTYSLPASAEGGDPGPEDPNRRGGGGGGGRKNRPASPGIVSDTLAAISGACTPYLTSYIQRGRNNDPEQVRRLQVFLRDVEGMTQVPVNGVYDDPTFEAVKVFQDRYVRDILSPWQSATPTGYVYVTTLRTINHIQCNGRGTAAGSAGVPACTVFTVPLRQGSAGSEVTKAQQFLVSQGWMTTPAAWGYFGPITAGAVKAMQARYASEILAPAGASAPTGNWLAMTMRKASELSCK